jgi:hypothetical protein
MFPAPLLLRLPSPPHPQPRWKEAPGISGSIPSTPNVQMSAPPIMVLDDVVRRGGKHVCIAFSLPDPVLVHLTSPMFFYFFFSLVLFLFPSLPTLFSP